jgi:Rieske 2Fe-2S family protein
MSISPAQTPVSPAEPAVMPGAAASEPRPGSALHPRLYTDPSVLDAEQRLIFERTWQLAGHISALPAPRSYITAQAGTQPVLVVRDEDNQLRAFKNVCRHRGSRLLSGSGQCKAAIRCRYHGWTYRLDGELIGVPEARAFGQELDKKALGLHPVRVEELCGLIFVNLDPDATPLSELLAGLPDRLERFGIAQLESFAPAEGDQPANWKVVVDNYLEGYHIPIAHPGLMRMFDYKHYSTEVHENYVWVEAPLREKPSSNRLERMYANMARPMAGLTPEDCNIWRYVFIYPNTTIDLYPDQVNTWHLRPDGVASTHDVAGCYRPRGSGPRTRFVQWANQRLNTLVLDEDVDLVKNVQQGLQTRGYECGPLSARERGVAWFADRIRADLEPVLRG